MSAFERADQIARHLSLPLVVKDDITPGTVVVADGEVCLHTIDWPVDVWKAFLKKCAEG